ncbi:hypothetical protein V5E97_11565 [Singulisphaera sp. Ch08]|uniref:Uncharacterized protein n=1 Tax=Singulisphaera sp. Ch08 TaxID=3120278 RepID=A0AAU7CNQ8_9BACT
MTLKAHQTSPSRRSRIRVPLLIVLALGTQSGCTREFFREWANQDVTEAIFEKSRDPRWRIDLFSVEPPALSRFADPYDPDAPPAPPDDYAAQALSPAPQWPDNRLMVPLEGTGYLDMLDTWQRESMQAGDAPPATPSPIKPRRTPAPAPTDIEPAPPVPSGTMSSPFGTGGNSGTPLEAIPPNSLSVPPPAANPPSDDVNAPQARVKSRDPGLRLAAFQQTGIQEPTTLSPSTTPPPGLEGPRRPEVQPPPIGMDPAPIQSDLSAPLTPRPDLTPEQYRESEEKGTRLPGCSSLTRSTSMKRRPRACPETAAHTY